MKKGRLLWLSFITSILILAGVSSVSAAEYFNLSDINNGVIHITYDGGGKTKLMIQKGDKTYTYDVNSAGKTENYPLQLGNGTYKISLLVNTSGNSYRLIASKSVDVQMTDQKKVFLTSVQNIDWNVDSKAIAKAVELTKGTDDLRQKAKILWNFMIKNNSYDYGKLAKLPTGYLPVIDRTLADKKGICYDFAALYAAMLRSEGIPAKLIKGYAPKNAVGYHAWNEVYDKSKGKWIVIDTTYDIQVVAKNPKVPMEKEPLDFNKVFEY